MDFFQIQFLNPCFTYCTKRNEINFYGITTAVRGGQVGTRHALFVSLPAVDIPAFEKGPSHYFSFLKES